MLSATLLDGVPSVTQPKSDYAAITVDADLPRAIPLKPLAIPVIVFRGGIAAAIDKVANSTCNLGANTTHSHSQIVLKQLRYAAKDNVLSVQTPMCWAAGLIQLAIRHPVFVRRRFLS